MSIEVSNESGMDISEPELVSVARFAIAGMDVQLKCWEASFMDYLLYLALSSGYAGISTNIGFFGVSR